MQIKQISLLLPLLYVASFHAATRSFRSTTTLYPTPENLTAYKVLAYKLTAEKADLLEKRSDVSEDSSTILGTVQAYAATTDILCTIMKAALYQQKIKIIIESESE